MAPARILEEPDWAPLDFAVVGGGIGGMAVAIALRRAGHAVTIYERADFAGEVGASVSCAANGARWLHEWDVDVPSGDPVVLRSLINRDWETGEPVSTYSLADYKKKWGYEYYMFHRQDMHAMLMESAIGEKGEGQPAKLVVNHKCRNLDVETGEVVFENGVKVKHDVVIGADGIGSAVRSLIGVHPEKQAASSSCLHANVSTEKAVALGLVDYSQNMALEYWGGHGSRNKIVLSPCRGGKLLSYYCFFPRDKGADYSSHRWDEDAPLEELLSPYPDLDRQVFQHLAIGEEIRPWRLWVHQPYPLWVKGLACVLGDAAHPMMPDQSQGACMAIEDAAALGIVFSRKYFRGDVRETLKLYERVRKPRATKVQAAAARARENIHERIGMSCCYDDGGIPLLNDANSRSAGFSSNTDNKLYKVKDEKQKLTVEEMNTYDMYLDVEGKLGLRSDTEGLPEGFQH